MAPGEELRTFPGRVWLGDDGLVDAVTEAGRPAPAGFATAPVVEVGDAVVHPGLVDLHSHLAYNTLPLWVEPTRDEPFLHHDSWPRARSYGAQVNWPAWALAELAPECVLAYAQVRALAGGTTTIQGWPTASRRPVNALLRSVDNDALGPRRDPVLVSALTLDLDDLSRRAQHLREGRRFVYHCAEGRPDTVVRREFDDLATAGCLRPELVAVHGSALGEGDFERWRNAAAVSARRAGEGRGAGGRRGAGGGQGAEPPGTLVWSPLSNLWLYGTTTDVAAASRHGIAVALGTDWGPSGTKNLLGELKVARLWSDRQGWGHSDHDLVRMVTSNPGDTLARAWAHPVGRLVPGALGDVTVLRRRQPDVWTNLVGAREDDVALVAVRGRAVYGTPGLLRAVGVGAATSVPVRSSTRRVTLVRPDDSTATWDWRDVLARLDAVRREVARRPPVRSGDTGPGARDRPVAVRDERTEATRSASRPGLDAGVGDPPGTPPLAVGLDMPGPQGSLAGPPPAGMTVQVPPIEPLHHNPRWLTSLRGRGFHGGVLDDLGERFR